MQLTVCNTSTSYQFFYKKAAPSIVLLHGWLQDWQSWSSIITELTKSYQVIVPDLPGFGSSSLDEAWTPENYAVWLASFLTALDLPKSQPIILCGHSFGGKIAAITAAIHKNTVLTSGLILIDSSGLPDSLSFQTNLKQKLVQVIPSTLKTALPTAFKINVLGKIGVATDHLQSNEVQRAVLKKTVQHSFAEYLPKIKAPTLIIWGEHDSTTPLHQGKAIHLAIPQAQLSVIPNAGHFPFIDNPTQVLSCIDAFVRSKVT